MTKSERRHARKAARAAGRRLTGELGLPSDAPRLLGEVDQDGPACEFTESPAGYDARDRWARHYDELNGAPEGEWDR